MGVNRGKNGQFLPGNSEGGRPKIPADVKEAIKAACPEAVQVLIALMRNPKEKTAYRLDAAKTLLDRGYGKPETMSKFELTGSNDGALVFRWETDEKHGNVEAPHEDFKS